MATDTLLKDLRRATPGRGRKNAGEALADARPLHLNPTGNTWGEKGAEILIAPPVASGDKRAAREGDRASAQQGKNHMAGIDYRRVLGLGRRRSQPASCGRRCR
jgi:hypothetical protein